MQLNLFAEEDRMKKISELGDNLEKLNEIDWEIFRAEIENALKKERKNNSGRPPFDCILMFKTIVLQRLYNLSDDQTEFQINDRISFMRFLKLSLADKVPDAKTIWLLKDSLTNSGIMESLFMLFNRQLEAQGLITHAGTIVDATFVDAPRQRNKREENQIIKEGNTPDEWKEKPHKLAQKDVDARWAIKGDERHFGYKDHVKVDSENKLVTDYAVTDASVHDSNEFVQFVNNTDKIVYADSAYVGKELPEGVENRVHEKGYRDHPLTEEQKESNRIKSKIRVRIEHVFGFMTGSMHGIFLRSIGIKRANFNIGLTNLIYNICRYAFLRRKKATGV